MKYGALNKKLDAILNQFTPPQADDGEVPDNGDVVVSLVVKDTP